MTATERSRTIPVIHEIGGFVSVRRAAEIMGTSETNVRKLVYRRDGAEVLRAVRLEGQTLLIEKQSAEQFVPFRKRVSVINVPRGT